MKLSEEMYRVKDLEIKAGVLKELKTLNKLLAYRFGPGEVQLLDKLKEDLKHEFEGSRS